MRDSKRRLWILACLWVLSVGCGGPRSNYDLVDLVDAHGNVTLDGKPLPGAVITFDDPSDDTMSYALTDTQGNYELQFDSEMSGVKVGPKIVRISTARKLLGLNTQPGQENSEPGEKPVELVPNRYNKASELKIEVTREQERYDFELVGP